MNMHLAEIQLFLFQGDLAKLEVYTKAEELQYTLSHVMSQASFVLQNRETENQ